MDNRPTRFEYRPLGGSSYLVLVEGTVIGALEKKVGPGRGYSGSKQFRSEQTTIWEASVLGVEELELSQDQRWAVGRAIKGRKRSRRFAAVDLVTAYARAEVDLPETPFAQAA